MSVCLCMKVHLNIVWKSDGIWSLFLHTDSFAWLYLVLQPAVYYIELGEEGIIV